MVKKKGITAWLVTWDCSGDHARPKRKIAAILNPRWSPERVRGYVEFIYVNSAYCLSERIGYANNRKFNPYPAKFMRVRGIVCTDQIMCGDNPWLIACKVDDLSVKGDSNDEDSVVWEEKPKRELPGISGTSGTF